MEELIFFAALLVFAYGLVSALAGRSPITAPMVFVTVGIAAGPLGLDLMTVDAGSEIVQVIAEITLILILFTAASTIDLRRLKTEYPIPLRLLAIGLPSMMVLGIAVAAWMFEGTGFWLIAVMALILSPTDAALAQIVVRSPRIPDAVRDAISVESGLNDGIALPPIMACIAAASAPGMLPDLMHWGSYTLSQIALGLLVGGLIGWAGGYLIDRAAKRRWMEPVYQRLASFALAVLCYALAEELAGNGFIAAFFGGLMLGARTPSVRERIQEFGEAEGQQLALFVFLIFGLAMVPMVVDHFDTTALVYALLSLTLIRMLPVGLSLIGSQLDLRTVGFIGWFGPRGIASILYTLILIGELGLTGNERILSVIVLTILLSIFAHGISAIPLSSWYARTTRIKKERSQ
ncbi:MAG: cation:proton antiporter [Xanthomonadales bacterium]